MSASLTDAGLDASDPPPVRPPVAIGRPRLRSARDDALRVLLGTLLTFVLASAFEWQEHVTAIARRFERWQVDELPLTLLALAVGLAWFAGRRRGESARLLALNRELAQRLIEVQERERREIARELHDELAQHCTAIRVETAVLQRCAETEAAAAAARRVADAARLMQSEVRRLLRRLRPAELDELGLAAALTSLAAAWEARSGLSVALRVEGDLERVDIAVATAVYRVAQEAIANVVRHAGASRAVLTLRSTAAALVLEVHDDGRGFDPSQATRGLGLVGVAERAAALGGASTVDTAPGAGTVLTVALPQPEAAR